MLTFSFFNIIIKEFKNCKFIAKSIDNLGAKMSASGDSVTFLKGEDGTYGKVYLPEGSYDKTFNGNDD